MANMFRIDNSEIDKLQADLEKLKDRALPFATKNTLNEAAFIAQKKSRRFIKRELTLRNKFTVSSIRVEKARTLNIRRQASIVGSTADYMETQEFGGLKESKAKEGVPIPTSYASGQQGAIPRTRLPRRPNKLANIRLAKTRFKNVRAKNTAKIKAAAQSGHKYIFLNLGRSKGIFKVVGGKRKQRIKMVWSLMRRSVRIPAKPWLKPNMVATIPLIPRIYEKSLKFQLKRHRIFD